MITQTKDQNEFITAIRTAIQANPNTTTLVIAHPNPRLKKRVSEAFPQETCSIVNLPQSEWCMDGGALRDAILWALNDRPIQRLVFLGCSTACSDRRGKLDLTETRDFDKEIADANRNRHASQTEFVKIMQVIFADKPISSRVDQNRLEVTGLFYRAESNLFSIYKRDQGSLDLLN